MSLRSKDLMTHQGTAEHRKASVEIGMKKPRKGDRRSFSEVKLLERYEFLKEFNLAPKIAQPLSP